MVTISVRPYIEEFWRILTRRPLSQWLSLHTAQESPLAPNSTSSGTFSPHTKALSRVSDLCWRKEDKVALG
jgi:hypothetical protein